MPRVFELPKHGKVVLFHPENSIAEDWAETRGLRYMMTTRVPWDKTYMLDVDQFNFLPERWDNAPDSLDT